MKSFSWGSVAQGGTICREENCAVEEWTGGMEDMQSKGGEGREKRWENWEKIQMCKDQHCGLEKSIGLFFLSSPLVGKKETQKRKEKSNFGTTKKRC